MFELTPTILTGATGKCISEYANRGAVWLGEKYNSHSPKVQSEVNKNAHMYLDCLGTRIERLEKECPSAKNCIEEALDHLGAALLMQKALLSAATTDNQTGHALLSEILAQRLTAAPEDNVSLIGPVACDIICSLSTRQFNFLGVLALLNDINGRPFWGVHSEYEKSFRDIEDDAQTLSRWRSLNDLSKGLESMTSLDLWHLEGLSCITPSSSGGPLYEIIGYGAYAYEPGGLFYDEPWFPRIDKLNHEGFLNFGLTASGLLIGKTHHDMVTKTHSELS